jgi:2-hydroxy-6-oxonona-2,4-dienedioate hydrolase
VIARKRPARIAVRVAAFLGALLLVLAVIVHGNYRHDIDAARARVATGSEIARTACGPIEYAVAGDGPPVLMIHGAGGGFDQGLAFGAPLVRAGFRVIAPSRFGYLRTPVPADPSPETQADAHACLLDTLGVRTVGVVGGSAGAPSAMQLCLRHPERCNALVLLVPIAWMPRPKDAPPPEIPMAARAVMALTLHSDFAYWAFTRMASGALVETLLATPLKDLQAAPPADRAFAYDVMRDVLPVTARARGLEMDSRLGLALPRYDLEHLTTPTLVVSAKDDLYGTYASGRYTAGHVPNARFVGFPDGGHLLVGHQKEAMEEIAAFLRDPTPTPPEAP